MDISEWRAVGAREALWKKYTFEQKMYYVDLCMQRSYDAKTSWGKRYWHGVAQDLVEKYVA